MSAPAPSVGTWHPGPPPLPQRLVVLAPHPDDEVLGTAGILRWAGAGGVATTVVACTDGEASHRRSRLVHPDGLRRCRAEERAAALAALGVDAEVLRLGLPDGALDAHEGELADAFGALGGAGTVLVAPWEHDGHPDHEAVGRAARSAAARSSATVWSVPIWAKVRSVRDLPPPLAALELSPSSRAAKAAAVACFRSQLVAAGPAPEDGPVVHPAELAAMLDGTEVVLA